MLRKNLPFLAYLWGQRVWLAARDSCQFFAYVHCGRFHRSWALPGCGMIESLGQEGQQHFVNLSLTTWISFSIDLYWISSWLCCLAVPRSYIGTGMAAKVTHLNLFSPLSWQFAQRDQQHQRRFIFQAVLLLMGSALVILHSFSLRKEF